MYTTATIRTTVLLLYTISTTTTYYTILLLYYTTTSWQTQQGHRELEIGASGRARATPNQKGRKSFPPDNYVLLTCFLHPRCPSPWHEGEHGVQRDIQVPPLRAWETEDNPHGSRKGVVGKAVRTKKIRDHERRATEFESEEEYSTHNCTCTALHRLAVAYIYEEHAVAHHN